MSYYAGWADKINGQVIPARADALTYTVREPLGVVGAIIPWNFPLMIGMWKSAPALACGCNLGAAVKAAASGIFFNTDQVCSAGSRTLVQRVLDYIAVGQREGARLANGTNYSLAAGVWTADVSGVHRMVRSLDVDLAVMAYVLQFAPQEFVNERPTSWSRSASTASRCAFRAAGSKS